MNPYWLDILSKLKDQTRPSKSLKEFGPQRQARWVKQKTRDTTQYKIVIIYIFKKKKNLTFGSSPLQEEGWIGRNRTGSYAGGKSGTNSWAILGWEVSHIALIIKFPFLFSSFCSVIVMCICVFFFFFRKRSGGDEIKSEKNAKKHFPQYLKTENHSSCQDSMNSG